MFHQVSSKEVLDVFIFPNRKAICGSLPNKMVDQPNLDETSLSCQKQIEILGKLL